MPSPIRFKFDVEKFVTVMLLLGKETPQLDVLKAAKLLYFIDREHLRKFGRPVLGDHYVAMKEGPVPSRAYDLLKDIRLGAEPSIPIRAQLTQDWKYEIFSPQVEPNLELLSESELASIRKIIEELGNLSGWELRNRSHEHLTWRESTENSVLKAVSIDYELFFKENPEECRDALEAMLIGQEDRDIVSGL